MVKIITDTTACLPIEFAKKHQIPVIPQIINFDEESYFEGTELSIEQFMERLTRSTHTPKTAAPPPELFSEEFRRLTPAGEPILCIHPSAEVSGTVRSATVAAQEFPGADIRVLDTRVVASPLGTMVELAAGWAEEGESVDTIMSRLTEMIPRCRIYFMVATLEYLARGGRIGGATALLGSVLQIKPILTLRDGKVDSYERERTHRRAVARLIEIVDEQCPHHLRGYPSIMHADARDQADELARELGQRLGVADIPIRHVPPAVVTHGGPGILGVAFFID